MKILAVETSTKNFSLAIFCDGKILACRNIRLKKVLSSSIIPSIDRILKEAKIPLARLDGYAVGLGPGSFTSLRVGLGTVKALSFVAHKPVVGISSLDALAMNVKNPHQQIGTICDARRNLLYSCIYEIKNGELKRKTKYLLCGIDDFLKQIKEDTLFIGDGIKLFKEEIIKSGKTQFSFAEEKYWYPRADKLALLAERRFREKKFDDLETLIPLYLYPDDCQVGQK